VFCQSGLLRQCFPPSVRRILEELSESLDETYERILREMIFHLLLSSFTHDGVEVMIVDWPAGKLSDPLSLISKFLFSVFSC
jgi:hypothetical protein